MRAAAVNYGLRREFVAAGEGRLCATSQGWIDVV